MVKVFDGYADDKDKTEFYHIEKEYKKCRQHFGRSESDNREEVSPLVSNGEFINNQLVNKLTKGG